MGKRVGVIVGKGEGAGVGGFGISTSNPIVGAGVEGGNLLLPLDLDFASLFPLSVLFPFKIVSLKLATTFVVGVKRLKEGPLTLEMGGAVLLKSERFLVVCAEGENCETEEAIIE